MIMRLLASTAAATNKAKRSAPSARQRFMPRRASTPRCVPRSSRGHSAHIGLDVVIHYRWHPLYGRTARRVQIERRATGDLVHIEHTSGVVTVLPAWKLDAVYCAGLKVGAPRVSLMALCALHEVLIACESRQVSADGRRRLARSVSGPLVQARFFHEI